MSEKTALAAAIRKSKDQLDIDMDSETGLNSARQRIAGIFRTMNSLRASEQTIANGGTGYRFNADGNQVTYRCDVRRVTSINFDRNVIRAWYCRADLFLFPSSYDTNGLVVREAAASVIRAELGKLDRAADETSAKLDLCTVTAAVDYAPPFDVNADFADAFETYLKSRS